MHVSHCLMGTLVSLNYGKKFTKTENHALLIEAYVPFKTVLEETFNRHETSTKSLSEKFSSPRKRNKIFKKIALIC